MHLAEYITVASLSIATASLLWNVFLSSRKRDISRPSLTLELGSDDLPWGKDAEGRRLQRLSRSSVIFGTVLKRNETGIFHLFVRVTNVSKVSAKSVQVAFNYPSDLLADPTCISTLTLSSGKQICLKEDDREVTVMGGNSQSTREFVLLRPGEAYSIMEPIIFRWSEAISLTEKSSETDGSLRSRLYAFAEIQDFFAIDVFVRAENCQPLSKRFNIIRINSESAEEIAKIVSRIGHGFWGGYPQPGAYFINPWKNPFRNFEQFEIIIPSVLDAVSATGKRYKFEEPHTVQTTMSGVMLMPPWNYYEERRTNFEANRSPGLTSLAQSFPFFRRRMGKVCMRPSDSQLAKRKHWHIG